MDNNDVAHVVVGVHKRTCDDCCADFNNEERYFTEVDASHSVWSSNHKLCKVCMIKVMSDFLHRLAKDPKNPFGNN